VPAATPPSAGQRLATEVASHSDFRLPRALSAVRPALPQFVFELAAFVCGENNNKGRPNGSQTMSKQSGNDPPCRLRNSTQRIAS